LEASKAFFLQALPPLGIGIVMDFSHTVGLGRGQKPSFWLGATDSRCRFASHSHLRIEGRSTRSIISLSPREEKIRSIYP
jgi:hypothetical protein